MTTKFELGDIVVPTRQALVDIATQASKLLGGRVLDIEPRAACGDSITLKLTNGHTTTVSAYWLRLKDPRLKPLDKGKVYRGFSVPRRGPNQSSSKRFSKVKILFEDGISYYVESLTDKDGAGFGKRYSAKKHCYVFEPIEEKVVCPCDKCPHKPN